METNHNKGKVTTDKLGATGEFPQGKINDDDEGELRAGIAIYDGKIVINFGKSVAWLGLLPEQALDFAKMLTEKANEITSKKNDEQGEN